ncbi:hypothetical protein BDZ94DRAFT_603816 [Collybia nuda]|uniref:Uncharacterized protein n=1 Tax=Collybia nuda TaxID=64659 RepID=A0A9P5Y7E7_9AGAR|nr:hypothetical protein BDZ94DRAFT_603816 [Collybia nuda]
MFSKVQVLATLLIATVATAARIPTTIPTTSLPKYSLRASDLGFSRARVTVTDSAPGIALTEPTLILCSAANCSAGCFRVAIAAAPVWTCQVPSSPPSFLSVVIDNPDATVIPWGVLVGDCNVSLVQIPQSNVCYNINPAGIHVARIDGTTTP